MKYLISLTFLLYSFNFYAQRCQVDSDKIQPNQVITIQYDPSGTDLVGEEVFAVAQVFEEGMKTMAHDVDLKSNGDGYSGTFKVPEKAQVIFINFENESQKVVDNNEKQGYVYLVHSGDKVSKETYLSAFYAVGPYARSFGINSNVDQAKMYFENATGGDAAVMMDFKHINAYANLLKMEKDKEGMASLKSHIEKVSKDTKGVSEKDLRSLWSTSTYLMESEELSKNLKEKIATQYPDGAMAANKKFEDFRKIRDVEESLKAYPELQAITKKHDGFDNQLQYATEILISRLAKAKDFEKIQKYIATIKSPSSKASIYNNLAWELAGGGLEGEAADIDFAEKISKQSLEWTKEAMESSDSKPNYLTARQWKKSSKFSYGMYSDTYALTAFKTGKTKDAVTYQKIAIESYNYKDADMNYRYGVYLEKEKGPKEAMAHMEKMISSGHANSAMKKDFERLYKANVNIDEAYSLYMTQLEKEAKALHLEEIKESMIEKNAPNFTLKNLDGETVSLESLKGKVVILDFWATWCGPCIASFPGMQKAVNKFKEDDEVAFIFIDTWESGKEKEKKAKEFIDTNGYSFNVLMDIENTMVADYEVDGIPAKFVLDKNGKIRFSSKGFGGNDDALVDEISAMVEILKSNGMAGKEKMGTRP